MDRVKTQLLDYITNWSPEIGLAVLALVGSWYVARVVFDLVMRLCSRKALHGPLVRFFARMARVGVLLFGVVTALGTLGVNISGLVAGLGLTGFALGFWRVTNVDLRYTELDGEAERFLVPNSRLLTDPIKVFKTPPAAVL